MVGVVGDQEEMEGDSDRRAKDATMLTKSSANQTGSAASVPLGARAWKM